MARNDQTRRMVSKMGGQAMNFTLSSDGISPACHFERDVYFNVPHPTLAWSFLRVSVRELEGRWEQAHEFNLSTTGMGTPFRGDYPSRESAGRNGLAFLRHALLRVNGGDAPEAQKHAEAIFEILNPSQLTLKL